MKLLIIEDNQRLAQRVKRALAKDHVVDIARTGSEGEQKALDSEYAVILLDLGLPDKTGHAVCGNLRHLGIKTPIIILTANDKLESRVSLLESGADDFLGKPFELDELRARIAALSRRSENVYVDSVIQIADLKINTTRREVFRAGQPIVLRRKEFDILQYLISNKGRAVTRNMILRHVWEADRDSWNNTVDVHIKHLRDKVDKPFERHLIKTAYGIGYMVDDTV